MPDTIKATDLFLGGGAEDCWFRRHLGVLWEGLGEFRWVFGMVCLGETEIYTGYIRTRSDAEALVAFLKLWKLIHYGLNNSIALARYLLVDHGKLGY